MAIEQFTVQATLPNVLIIVTVALIVSGIVLLGANRLLRNRLKDRQVYGKMIVGIGIGVNSKHIMALIGVFLIIIGGILGWAVVGSASPLIVTVGEGYINVESHSFDYIGSIFCIQSNKNVTSEEIARSFIGQVGSGNLIYTGNTQLSLIIPA
jgi:hypothetical protein